MIKLKQDERTKPCLTNTQHKINLSGYQWFKNILDPINNKTILDNACGTGYGTYYLSKYCKKIIGIDISQEAVSYATRKFKDMNIFEMDSTKLDFADNYFDAVISQDTIEHIPDDQAFVSEIHRVLKESCKAIIFTPHSKIHNDSPENEYHVREYSKETFDDLLRRYFGKIKYYSRRQGSQLKSMEQAMNGIRRFDIFYLRRIIPRKARGLLGSCLTYLKTGRKLSSVSLEDIEYCEGIADDASLIAICQK